MVPIDAFGVTAQQPSMPAISPTVHASADELRVLMVIRGDAQRNLGGDTVQLRKTKSGLETLGVSVQVRGAEDRGRLPDVDIAHVFNIQTADASWQALQRLVEAGIPTVLSSIYWDMLEHWFEFALRDRRRWRLMRAAIGKRRARAAYVAWQRNKEAATSTWQMQRALLQTAKRVLPNSQSEADLLAQTFDLGDDFLKKVDVVPNGIDPELYARKPSPDIDFITRYGTRDFVLQVGAISPVKNQLGLIQALWDLPLPLVFIGQAAAAMPEYAEECKALGALRGSVQFVERLPHASLPGIYAAAAVHVLPSWRETPGLASLEAAAVGCRVVTTSIGSTRDYFGDFAEYCYPDDHYSIRTAVEAALARPRSDELRNHVLQHHTWLHAAEATLAAYRRALVAR